MLITIAMNEIQQYRMVKGRVALFHVATQIEKNQYSLI